VTAPQTLTTMGMMPNISDIYDNDGLLIGTAAELTEDDDMYYWCRQINIPRLLC
jgi:hypothetical protein